MSDQQFFNPKFKKLEIESEDTGTLSPGPQDKGQVRGSSLLDVDLKFLDGIDPSDRELFGSFNTNELKNLQNFDVKTEKYEATEEMIKIFNQKFSQSFLGVDKMSQFKSQLKDIYADKPVP